MPAVVPKISLCWRNSQALKIQGSAAELPAQPCHPSPTTLISLPTPSPSPGKPAPRIPLPEWTWNSFAKTRSWTNHFPAAAQAAPVGKEEVPDKVAPVAVREAEEALAAVEEASEAGGSVEAAVEAGDAAEAEAEAAAEVVAALAISVISSLINPTARSSGL